MFKKYDCIFILIILIGVFLSQNKSFAQIWSPPGAEWHYSYSDFFQNGYIRIIVEGDTTIGYYDCQKLLKTKFFYDYMWQYDSVLIGTEITRYDEDKVYILRNDQFYVLYDFSAKPGDVWVLPQTYPAPCDTTGFVEVVDTGIVTINNQSLRFIKVVSQEGSQWGFLGDTTKIVERIGPENSYLLPEQQCTIDLFEGGEFRCYQDETFGLYQIGIVPFCDYILSSSQNVSNDLKLLITPNPAISSINIILPELMTNVKLTVVNIYGINVKSVLLDKTPIEVNISELRQGIYTLIFSKDDIYLTYKLLKTH